MNRTSNKSWKQLEEHAKIVKFLHLRELFKNYRADYEKYFCLKHNGLILDIGKQRITAETLNLLRGFAEQMEIQTWIKKMLDGEFINHTEKRAVGHIKLRAGNNAPAEVKNVLQRMENFADQIHSGIWKGYSGKAIKNIVSIGIGGSDLGVRMVMIALSAVHLPQVKLHFVSNVDSADLVKKLAGLNPETTLFVVESKTFTTQETMRNAESAKMWILNYFHEKSKKNFENLVENKNENKNKNENEIVKQHFVAVSTNIEATQKFGIAKENVFEFWDWVGGRFSLWSAIGLPIMLAVGKKHFADLLAGANDIDKHFIHSDLDKNLPLTMALLSVWNTNFLNAPSFAVFPYSQSLTRFPRYLQQLEMESNGKTVNRNSKVVNFATSPIVWGTAGTNGQHSYFQLLHQGGQIVASDFIGIKKSDFPQIGAQQNLQQHQNILLANCLAQSAALAFGQTAEEAKNYGISADLLPYRIFKGNQPSTTLLLPELTPFTLGQLLALYEHKVFCLGILWNLNSFDQWGVELGKHLAGKLLPFFETQNTNTNAEVFNNLDHSTQLLLNNLLNS